MLRSQINTTIVQCWVQTQGFRNARQALYQVSSILHPASHQMEMGEGGGEGKREETSEGEGKGKGRRIRRPVYQWQSEDKLQESALFFHLVNPRN